MASKNATIELWVMVDADGEYGVGNDQETAEQAYADNVGGSGPTRLIKIDASVPLPTVLAARVTIPAPAERSMELTATIED